jgi:hypothetical protein
MSCPQPQSMWSETWLPSPSLEVSVEQLGHATEPVCGFASWSYECCVGSMQRPTPGVAGVGFPKRNGAKRHSSVAAVAPRAEHVWGGHALPLGVVAHGGLCRCAERAAAQAIGRGDGQVAGSASIPERPAAGRPKGSRPVGERAGAVGHAVAGERAREGPVAPDRGGAHVERSTRGRVIAQPRLTHGVTERRAHPGRSIVDEVRVGGAGEVRAAASDRRAEAVTQACDAGVACDTVVHLAGFRCDTLAESRNRASARALCTTAPEVVAHPGAALAVPAAGLCDQVAGPDGRVFVGAMVGGAAVVHPAVVRATVGSGTARARAEAGPIRVADLASGAPSGAHARHGRARCAQRFVTTTAAGDQEREGERCKMGSPIHACSSSTDSRAPHSLYLHPRSR